MNKKDKMKKKYRLMNKLLQADFTVEVDEQTMTSKIDAGYLCTAHLCLISAIAKRTNANMYTLNNKIVLYTTGERSDMAHYLRWADKQIKMMIEQEE